MQLSRKAYYREIGLPGSDEPEKAFRAESRPAGPQDGRMVAFCASIPGQDSLPGCETWIAGEERRREAEYRARLRAERSEIEAEALELGYVLPLPENNHEAWAALSDARQSHYWAACAWRDFANKISRSCAVRAELNSRGAEYGLPGLSLAADSWERREYRAELYCRIEAARNPLFGGERMSIHETSRPAPLRRRP